LNDCELAAYWRRNQSGRGDCRDKPAQGYPYASATSLPFVERLRKGLAELQIQNDQTVTEARGWPLGRRGRWPDPVRRSAAQPVHVRLDESVWIVGVLFEKVA
jgi:hypothetical protein